MTEAISGYLFYEIASLLVLAAGVGMIGVLLRQPLIVSFIAVGILAGPDVLNLARSDAPIEMLAKLGIALLLFLVGLKLDLSLVRKLGRVAVLTGLGQVAFTSIVGFVLAYALGLDTITAVYTAVALTFSSTIIIVKLLTDKGELDALHGRIALGFLIVQDLVVVIAMMTLSTLKLGDAEAASAQPLLWQTLGSGVGLLLAAGVFMRYLANPLVHQLARAPELLVCFAIGWAALLASVGHYLGFGKELGGLLAGVTLASTPLRDQMAARLAPLRDFLLLFFFIALGSSLKLSLLGSNLPAAALLSAFVLLGNPLIVLLILNALGYSARTGFLAGLTVAQISEFSLIFMAMGVSLGHVSEDALGLVTLVGLLTIAASTYMISYSHVLYAALEPWLKTLPRRARAASLEDAAHPAAQADFVIIGMGRYGWALAAALQREGCKVLGVDMDPDIAQQARLAGLPCRNGDVGDGDFVAELPLAGAQWVVSTLPPHPRSPRGEDPQFLLQQNLRSCRYQGQLALSSNVLSQAPSGVVTPTLILHPYIDAAERAAQRLLDTSTPRTS